MLCELTIVTLFVITLINFFAMLDCCKSTIKKSSESYSNQSPTKEGGNGD